MIFNPPSVAASQQEESQHNTSGLSSFFGAIPSVLQYQQIDTPQPFSPSQLQPAPAPVPSSTHQEQSRLPASPASRFSPNQRISPHKSHQTGPSKGHPNLPKPIIQLLLPKYKKAHRLTLTLPPNT